MSSSINKKLPLLAALVLGAVLGLVLPKFVGNTSHATSLFKQDTPNAADIGFAQDMAVHHAQAVDMAMLAKVYGGDAVKAYGGMIGDTQNREIGRFFGWLEAWGEPAVASEPMAWMHDMSSTHAQHAGHTEHTHGHHHMSEKAFNVEAGQAMADAMGMASYAEMEKLRHLRGDAFDKLFLQLMIRHHQGGVLMAAAAVKDGNTPLVQGVALQIAAEQQKEILQMSGTLKALDGEVLPYNPSM